MYVYAYTPNMSQLKMDNVRAKIAMSERRSQKNNLVKERQTGDSARRVAFVPTFYALVVAFQSNSDYIISC